MVESRHAKEVERLTSEIQLVETEMYPTTDPTDAERLRLNLESHGGPTGAHAALPPHERIEALRQELEAATTAAEAEAHAPPASTDSPDTAPDKKPWYDRWSKGLAKVGVSAIKSPLGGVKLVGKGFFGTIIAFLGSAVLLLQTVGGKKMTDADQLLPESRSSGSGHGSGDHRSSHGSSHSASHGGGGGGKKGH